MEEEKRKERKREIKSIKQSINKIEGGGGEIVFPRCYGVELALMFTSAPSSEPA
jgi:hypothetical protein